MMSLLVILGAVIAVFAFIGRITTPSPERLPFTQWTFLDVCWNFRRGLYICSKDSVLAQLMDKPERTDNL